MFWVFFLDNSTVTEHILPPNFIVRISLIGKMQNPKHEQEKLNKTTHHTNSSLMLKYYGIHSLQNKQTNKQTNHKITWLMFWVFLNAAPIYWFLGVFLITA